MRLSVSDRAGLTHKLSHSVYYQQAIDKLYITLSARPAQLHALQSEGFSFTQAYVDRKRLSRILARSVASGEYAFAPATLHDITIGGKRRRIYAFRLTDRIVHGAIYRMLAEDVVTPPEVYSYVKGRNRQQALAALSRYVRAHRLEHSEPRRRGLYVLRCDIRTYGESIPVLPSSPLWSQLTRQFPHMTSHARTLLEQLVRPVIRGEEGDFQLLYGIPDGAPISALLLNLYARPLDEALSRIRGGFYARYGDDMVFAHPDRDVFRIAEKKVDDALRVLDLTRNEAKSQRYFFNGAGRPAEGFSGTSRIEFLGLSLGFDGTVALKTQKLREVFSDLAIRLRSTEKATGRLSTEERGRILCEVLNAAFDPASVDASAHASVLRYLVSSREQLRQIDYRLARMVLSAMTHNDSARQFRKFSYQTLRRDWRLRSLEYARNH